MPNNEHLPLVSLHKEGEDDEPLGLDVDVTVTCDCGTSLTDRKEICKEVDWVSMMCDGCGATYRVDVSTELRFKATLVKESGSVLEEAHALD